MATVCALSRDLSRSFFRSVLITSINRQPSHFSTLTLSANASYGSPNAIADIHNDRDTNTISDPYGLSNPNMFYTTEMPPICGELYRQWRDDGRRRYADAPMEGIPVTGSYFDNIDYVGANARSKVLMLHGTPGNYKHFNGLINHLTSQGIRVIAPNFPGRSISY